MARRDGMRKIMYFFQGKFDTFGTHAVRNRIVFEWFLAPRTNYDHRDLGSKAYAGTRTLNLRFTSEAV